jgi:hypothetical protein
MKNSLKNIKSALEKFISSPRNLLIIFILFALAASLQSLSSKKVYDNGDVRNRYNNYTIFERSFHHLTEGRDLYVAYPAEYWDLYKYTPTFSLFFGIFAIFPDWAGLSLWNLLNALVLLMAIYYLPKLSRPQKGGIALIVLIELMTCMQNEQSNALIAGLLLLAFGLLEKNKPLPATLCIVFTGFIKLFGIVGFALLLFYPKKWKLAVYSLLWTLLLLALPLAVVSMEQYYSLFISYMNMLTHDHLSSYGYSVMGWLSTWFHLYLPKNLVVGAGVLIFLVPLLRLRMYADYSYRMLTLASVLLWIVIFNHKAESPTFIIAITGIALWFVAKRPDALRVALLIFALVFTSLSTTDLFPPALRTGFFQPYVLKAIPSILIWGVVVYEMMSKDRKGSAPAPA